MMSIEYIRELARDAADEARANGRLPLVFSTLPVIEDDIRAIPFTGELDFAEQGWRKIEELFVDSSGFGSEGEPALTVSAFLAYVNAHVGHQYGYAISEAGQFQVYITVWQTPAGALVRGH